MSVIRSQGEWLFHNATTTGDWHSAAIALRQDVARLADEKAALVRALEAAWATPAVELIELDTDGLNAFTAEVELM